MKNLWKLIVLFISAGVLIFGIFYNKKESKNLKLDESNNGSIITPIVKKEYLMKEVKNLGRLEFFKMYAMEEKKLLMVYFYSERCYYCTKMKETLSDSQIQKILEKDYMVVGINYSHHKQEFKASYNLKGTPAMFFFDRTGKMLREENFYGYRNVEDFLNQIELLRN